jgi:MFS family permease
LGVNARASGQSLRGLDWFAFFVAEIQTGWGPFVAVYLTSVAWTQLDIVLVLTIGTLATFALQIPAGALVDRVPAKRSLVVLAVTCVSGSALLLALWPTFGVVAVAKMLDAIANCMLGPAHAAISLGLVGHDLLSVGLGRNARFLYVTIPPRGLCRPSRLLQNTELLRAALRRTTASRQCASRSFLPTVE